MSGVLGYLGRAVGGKQVALPLGSLCPRFQQMLCQPRSESGLSLQGLGLSWDIYTSYKLWEESGLPSILGGDVEE